MKIAFYADKCLPIHAQTLAERPLGGTETGLIRLAAELSARGHEVIVFTSFNQPPPSVPRYLPFEVAPQLAPFDVFVAVKDWRSLFFQIPAKQYFFWTGDGVEQFVNYGFGDLRVERRIKALLCASRWQRDSLCAASGYDLDRVAIIGNGVHPELFAVEEPRHRRRLIYTSAPYRGLEFLEPIFLTLKPRFPDLELHVFSGMKIYDTDQPFQGPHLEHERALAERFRKIPGITLHGNVLQAELAREYLRSSIFAYPNSVHETFCITAIEAQAAGCPVVASENSALPESVGEGGVLITGEVGSREYLERFTLALARLLSDDAEWAAVSAAARKRVAEKFTWSHVADRFLGLIE